MLFVLNNVRKKFESQSDETKKQFIEGDWEKIFSGF
jgi:hypothetical protein